MKKHRVGKAGLALVKRFEGLRLTAYHLPGETYRTIGWGHYGPDVKSGMKITRQRADELLLADLKDAVAAVNRLVRVPLTQGQFDALVCFAFNVGIGAFASSTLLKEVNEQHWKRATAQFGRWVFGAGHKKLLGLVRRRGAEAALFWKSRPRRKKPKLTLRATLAAKARAGRFDPRMCGYYAAPTNVNAAVKRAICRAYAAGLVPTYTTNGAHSPGSYHTPLPTPNGQGVGRAVDLGLRNEEVGTTKGRKRMEDFQRREHAAYHRGKRPHMVELIGPINHLVVLRDREVDLAEGAPLEQQHDNHVHVALV